MPEALSVAHRVVSDLGIADRIQRLYVERVDSPWNEKAMIKRKRGLLEVKFTLWKENLFLLGRMYHIFLYIYDVLDPPFMYDPRLTPNEESEPDVRDIYNQVWSIYVDSRIERRGIENFYDRIVRRNLFVDLANHLPRDKAVSLFQKLWESESYTYPEIVDFSYRLLEDRKAGAQEPPLCLEAELAPRLKLQGVRVHIDRIKSESLRHKANDLLSFIAYHCKDAVITGSYFGILVVYHRRVFVEMVIIEDDHIFVSILDVLSNTYRTHPVTEDGEVTEIQGSILTLYKKIALQS